MGVLDPAWSSPALAKIEHISVQPLARYLAAGQALPNDGVADAYPLIQAALNDLVIKADANPGVKFILGVPAGRYKTSQTMRVGSVAGRTTTVERVGVRGAGVDETIFLPQGNSSGFVTLSPGATVAACTKHYYGNFTIDLTAATHPDPSEGLYKGFASRGYVDCQFERIKVVNSPATAYGVDFPVRTTFTDCHVVTTGDGAAGGVYDPAVGPVAAAKSISGFGIGFGLFADESMTLIGCTATDCQRAGVFCEMFDAANGYTIRNASITLIGCRLYGNRIGVSNVGCHGVTAVNCDITDNTVTGAYAGVSGRVTQFAGRNDTYLNCDFRRNAVGVYATGDATNTRNYVTPRDVLGAYRILDCRFDDNTGPAVLAERYLGLEAGGLTVRGNSFRRNAGPAVWIKPSAGPPLRDVMIEGNYFDANTGSAVKIQAPMNAPRLTGNTFVNSDGGTVQAAGIELHVAEPVTAPMISGNTFRKIPNPLLNVARLDQTHVTGNRVLDSTTDPDVAPRLYGEAFFGGGSALWPVSGDGWLKNTGGTGNDWNRGSVGIACSGNSSTPNSLIYRDLGGSGVYAECGITSTALASTSSQMIGVMLALASGTSRTALVAGVNGAVAAFGANPYYAVWRINGGTPTLVWQSTVPMTERHSIALARKAGATLTDVFIDGELVQSIDVPQIAASSLAGVFSQRIDGQNRFLTDFRAMSYA